MKLLAIDKDSESLAALKRMSQELDPKAVFLECMVSSELIELARREHPDLLVLGSSQDGALCQKLKHDPDLKFIPILALLEDRTSRQQAWDHGVDAWLVKPIDLLDFHSQVRLLLNSSSGPTKAQPKPILIEADPVEPSLKTPLDIQHLQTLLEASQFVLEKADFSITARRIFDAARKVTGAQSGYVALLNETGEENQVLFLESGGLPCSVDPSLPMPVRGLRGEAYRSGQVVYENDFMASQWAAFMPSGHVDLKNVLFAPLNIEGKTMGILGLANKPSGFTEEDRQIAGSFGNLAAIALKNSRYLDELKVQNEELRQSREALQQTQAILQAALDQSSAGIAIADAPDGKLRYVNDAGLLIRGGDRTSVVEGVGIQSYVEIWRILDFDGKPLTAEEVPLARAVLFGESSQREFLVRRDDEEDRMVQAHAAPIRNSEGQVVAGIVVFTDITEHKRIETELRQQRDLANRIIEDGPLAITRLDPSGRIIFANPQAERVLGLSPDGCLGRTYNAPSWKITSPDGSSFPEEEIPFHRILSTKNAVHGIQHAIQLNDGTRKILSISGAPLLDLQGRIEQVVMAIEDITVRKQAEMDLRETRDYLDNLFTYANAPIITWNAQFQITRFNHAFENLFGLLAEQVLGRDLSILFPENSRDRSMEGIRRSVGERWEVLEIPILNHLTGDTRIVLWNSAHVLGPDGQTIQATIAQGVDITERKRAEAKLQASEEKFATAFHLSPYAMTITRLADGCYLSFNDRFCETFGFEPSEVQNRSSLPGELGIWIQAEDRRQFVTDLQRDGLLRNREYAFRRKDGSTLIGQVSSRLFDLAGETCVLSITQDISEQKRLENELKKSEAKHRQLFETMAQGVVYQDDDGSIVDANPAAERILGLSLEQILGRTSMDPRWRTIREDGSDMPGEEHAAMVALRTGRKVERFPMGVFNPVQNGIRWLSVTAIPIFREGEPKPYQVHVTFDDLTEQRKAEEDYRILFQQMLDGFAVHEIVCDEDGKPIDYRFLAVNPAFEQMTGLKAQDVVGRRVLEIMPDTEAYWIETYGHVASTGEATHFENYSHALKKHFEIQAFRPGPGQFACIFTDVTERKSLEKQLIHSQKMESVGRLAGGVAHDFNNMLAVILGMTEMALEQVGSNDPLHRDLLEIQKAAQRSANLTRQLLAFARKQTVMPKVLDLNDTIEGMLRMLRRLVGENLDLVWIPGPGLWAVKMDPAQIDQILANLCVNARDAISDVGKLTLETNNVRFDEAYCANHPEFVPGDYVCLAVSDNGKGMDRETQEHLFEPFFTTKGVGQGTGLGLATVYGIVRQNHGFINVYSELGHGTIFRIYLPIYLDPSQPLKKEETQEALPLGLESILLVEDEPMILDLSQKMLTKLGYQVLAARTPGEALRLAERHAGDLQLLVTDVVMPEMNGRELAKKLHSLYPKLKCLFMSGYTANVIAHHGVLDEGVHFLQKPFSLHELARIVRQALSSV